MTITAQPSARHARRSISPAPQQVSTPVLLRAAAALVIVATIVVALVLAASARHLRGALDVLGQQTAPHVEATEDLYFELSDMDAQLTNVLLAGNDPALAAVRREALTTYEQRRTQADKDLQEAMKLAGAGDSARSLRDVLDHLGEYHGLAQRTIMLNDLEP